MAAMEWTPAPDAAFCAEINRRGACSAQWLENLPDLWRTLSRQWGLSAVGPSRTGKTSLVVPVATTAGARAALKLVSPVASARTEASALAAFSGHGAVTLLDADLQRDALLLEWLDGPALSDMADKPAAMSIAGRLARELAGAPPPHETPRLAGQALDWATQLHQQHEQAQRAGTAFSDQHFDVAVGIVQQLSVDETQTLTHGDLSLFNIVRSGADRWVAIDPVLLVGTSANEAHTVIRSQLAAITGARDPLTYLSNWTRRFTEAAGVDYSWAQALSFARYTASFYWESQNHGAPDNVARLRRIAMLQASSLRAEL